VDHDRADELVRGPVRNGELPAGDLGRVGPALGDALFDRRRIGPLFIAQEIQERVVFVESREIGRDVGPS